MNGYAEFYKCALQVNPYSYSATYRGQEHIFDEDYYNHQVLKNCISEDIKVVGLADHGNITSSETLRKLLSENGIRVFPGFEIATAEKIHIVCLFSDTTTPTYLDRYLGKLGLTNVENGILPSDLSCPAIAKIVDELKGFWYAAHVTSDNGILKVGQMQHIWTDERLKAAQIPATRDEIDPKFLNILNNTDPNYKRERPIALINSKDIRVPDDLLNKSAVCLVKMSEITFECFKQGFQDPDSRIRLLSDMDERFHSVIEKIEIFGGYLDGVSIDFSRNLNTLIGGRGTGKSTLIEIIRYALGLEPRSIDSKKVFKELIKANLGMENGRVELHVTSNSEYGKRFKITKRYEQPIVIENADGIVSNLGIQDILPHIEIYGQNEIIEIILNEESKLQILDRFLPQRQGSMDDILDSLKRNADLLVTKSEEDEGFERKISKIPKLREREDFFKESGVAAKLGAVESLSAEEAQIQIVLDSVKNHNITFPEMDYLTEYFLGKTNNLDLFKKINDLIVKFNLGLLELKDRYESLVKDTATQMDVVYGEWNKLKETAEMDIRQAVSQLDGFNGKSGAEIALEYRDTVKELAQIQPLQKSQDAIKSEIKVVEAERRRLLEQMKKNQDGTSDLLRKVVKNLNKKKLKGKIRIEIYPAKNRDALIKFLSNIEGLGSKTLEWINEVDDLSIWSLVENVELGSGQLVETYGRYGLTKAKAEILSNMSFERKLRLEMVQLLDVIDVQLNVSSIGEAYRSLSKLSKGQQCTAILNILLLDNKDTLIIDQPEDNLDNSYIANNFVDGLRQNKINRQFIFATHNANIPVFGDAELIVVMQEVDGQGNINRESIGSIDSEIVKREVVNTLEGGRTAFQMRRLKYNL